MKVCYKCKRNKRLQDFHRCSSRLDGRVSVCKKCKREYDLKRPNFKSSLEKLSKWREANNVPRKKAKKRKRNKKFLQKKRCNSKKRRDIITDDYIKDLLRRRNGKKMSEESISNSDIIEIKRTILKIKRYAKEKKKAIDQQPS